MGPCAYAQSFTAEVRIDLNPAEFNFQGLSPVPTATGTGEVFAGGEARLTISIRQWSDGTITVATPTRTQTYDQSTGASQTNTTGAELSISPNTVFSGSGTVSSAQETSIQTSANVLNSLSFKMEGNLLIAHSEYTINGVKYSNDISLGEVTIDGGFLAFYTGFLEGKSIIVGSPITTTSPSGAPGKAQATGKRGRVNSSSTPIYANVLAGYWVYTATVKQPVD